MDRFDSSAWRLDRIRPMSQARNMPDPHDMTDAQLVERWNEVENHDELTPADQTIIDEMERREIDF